MGHLGVVFGCRRSWWVIWEWCLVVGEADGSSWRGSVWVLGRGVPWGSRKHPGRTEGHRQRDRHDKDDTAHQGSLASTHSYTQEQVCLRYPVERGYVCVRVRLHLLFSSSVVWLFQETRELVSQLLLLDVSCSLLLRHSFAQSHMIYLHM